MRSFHDMSTDDLVKGLRALIRRVDHLNGEALLIEEVIDRLHDADNRIRDLAERREA